MTSDNHLKVLRAVKIVASLTPAMFSMGWSAVLGAQNYPVKPIRFVAPFAPGGGTDFIGRVAAQKLTEALKQQVIVESGEKGVGSLFFVDIVQGS